LNSFFQGKVWVKPLSKTEQPSTRPEVRARLLSPNGELAVLGDGENPNFHLAYVELKEGKVRGNHFHKIRHEYFYMIAGEVEFFAEEIATKQKIKSTLQAGDLVFISPEIAHAFSPAASGHAIEYAAERFDATDVFRYPVGAAET
jgi:quercetin dioxygenase-like cupin family protein